MIRVALVGLGQIAQKHLITIVNNKKLKLVAICDNNKKKITNLKKLEQFENINFYFSYDKLIEFEKIECCFMYT